MKALAIALVEVMTAQQVEIVRRDVAGLAGNIAHVQGDLQRFCDRCRDLILDGEDVVQFPVEGIRPQVESIGGIDALVGRVDASFAHFRDWIADTPYFSFLARDAATISPTSVCLVISDGWFGAQEADLQSKLVKEMQACLEAEGVALDIGAYRDAPTGLRIWGGPTVDPDDIAALLPWLDWAYAHVLAAHQSAQGG